MVIDCQNSFSPISLWNVSDYDTTLESTVRTYIQLLRFTNHHQPCLKRHLETKGIPEITYSCSFFLQVTLVCCFMQWSIGYTTHCPAIHRFQHAILRITSKSAVYSTVFVWFCFISILEKQAPKTCHVFFPSGILVAEGSYKPSDGFFGGLYHQSVEYEKTVFQSTCA